MNQLDPEKSIRPTGVTVRSNAKAQYAASKPRGIRNSRNSEEAQVLNYLKATGLGRGLLLNFGTPRLVFKRFAFSQLRTSAQSVD